MRGIRASKAENYIDFCSDSSSFPRVLQIMQNSCHSIKSKRPNVPAVKGIVNARIICLWCNQVRFSVERDHFLN